METRLARTRAEIRTAQEIRYAIFYEEMGAKATMRTRLRRRDSDGFDRYCDHLLVIDKSDGFDRIVGTYRLLSDRQARLAGGYYTETEFDVLPLLRAMPQARFLELGRSCILPQYRSKRSMELMWQGLWAYVLENKIDVMFGCASFPGTNPQRWAPSLAWLNENATISRHDLCSQRSSQSVRLADLTIGDASHDPRRALANLPPLLKGYLRAGAKIGPEAVIDHQFGTIDVLVVLKVADINPRYLAHYGTDASRFAA